MSNKLQPDGHLPSLCSSSLGSGFHRHLLAHCLQSGPAVKGRGKVVAAVAEAAAVAAAAAALSMDVWQGSVVARASCNQRSQWGGKTGAATAAAAATSQVHDWSVPTLPIRAAGKSTTAREAPSANSFFKANEQMAEQLSQEACTAILRPHDYHMTIN